jgi:glycerate-2-kinase
LLVRRTLDDRETRVAMQRAAALDVIAAGKAAAPMIEACAAAADVPLRTLLAIGPRRGPESSVTLPPSTIWYDAGHPLPDGGSVAGARRALEVARASGERDLLLVLISGGGSSLMALPVADMPIEAKQRTARILMEQGADIYELNTVRKHLSAIKGGQLALAARGSVLTLAVSDVVGDDLSVIASGPTVADDSTFAGALDVLDRRGGRTIYPEAVVDRLVRGAAGDVPETPSSGDPRLARTVARVIGPQRGAIEGARRAADALGYHVHIVHEPVTGEARDAARQHIARTAQAISSMPRPVCVIASGETTGHRERRREGRPQSGVYIRDGAVAGRTRRALSRRPVWAPMASMARPMPPGPSSIPQHLTGGCGWTRCTRGLSDSTTTHTNSSTGSAISFAPVPPIQTSAICRSFSLRSNQDLLHRIREAVHHPATARELMQVLRVPREERAAFKRQLKTLVSSGDLLQIRGNRFGLPEKMDLIVGRLTTNPVGSVSSCPEHGEGG